MEQITGNSSTNGYIYIFIAIIGWGLSTTFIELGLQSINPLPFLTYRFTIAVLVLSPFVLVNKRNEIIKILKNKWTWAIGVSESSGLILQYFGQRSVPAGLAALLSLLFLLIVPFLSVKLLDEKITSLHIVAIVISLIGLIFISSEGKLSNLKTNSIAGVLLLLGAAFSYALYIVSTSKLTTKEEIDVDIFTLFFVILTMISISSGVLTIVFDEFNPIPKNAYKYIFLLTIFSTIIAFYTYFKALEVISANLASVLLLLQVLIPFAIDYFYFHKIYSSWIILGSGLILVAILLVVSIPYFEDK